MSLRNELRQFSGTTQYFLHFTGLKYTDGIKYLAEKAEAYWLIDVVGSYQYLPEVKATEPQFWQLDIAENKSAVVTMVADSGCKPVVRQEIEFSDFPLSSIKIWVCDGVLMLPSEY